MVELYQNNHKISFRDIIIEESLNYYSSFLRVSTDELIDGNKDVQLNLNGSVGLYRTMRNEGPFSGVHILYPSNYVKALNQCFYATKGYFSVSEFCNTIGLNYKSNLNTSKSYWNIGNSKFCTVIDVLSKYTNVLLGGGACYYFGLDNNLKLVDLKTSWNSDKVVAVAGQIGKETISTEWINSYPGTVNITKFTVDGEIGRASCRERV